MVRSLTLQYLKFGVVGIGATLVHAVVFAILVERLGQDPMMANMGGYAVAVVISYFGNFRWTFGASRPEVTDFLKFCLVTVVGFAINSAAVWVIMERQNLTYPYVLPVFLGVTPVVVFTINRVWTFRRTFKG
jgi:putative flippase GtrA